MNELSNVFYRTKKNRNKFRIWAANLTFNSFWKEGDYWNYF